MMKRKVYSLIAVLAATACFCCAPVTGHAATPNPNYENANFNYYNMIEQSDTGWQRKLNSTDVYINPTSGPALYYTVKGKKLNNETNYRSGRVRITNGAQAGVANDAYENGDSDVCLHMERTTSGQVYTSGVWNPHTI